MQNKVSYPTSIEEAIKKYTLILEEEGFFNDDMEFPPNMEETAKTHLWNFLGEILMEKFLDGTNDYIASPEEISRVITNTVIQTNLDSLMEEKLIDGIENEDGEMVYFLTDKGKQANKDMGEDDIKY